MQMVMPCDSFSYIGASSLFRRMKSTIQGFIDFEKVDILLEGFNKATGFVTAVVDHEGNILSKSGWRQICTEFHRINPETAQRCRISDTELANAMAEGLEYNSYQCLNGLVDVVVPVVISGEHVANLFSGQFFFEEPDKSYFKKQAQKFGFDEKKYLDALAEVPVVSQEKMKVVMDFLLNMTKLISEMTFQKLEQTELNEALTVSEEKMRSIYSVAPVGIGVVVNRVLKEVNIRVCEMTGYSREELLEKNARILYPSQEDYEFVGKYKYEQIKEKGTGEVETRWQKKDGSVINVLMASTPIDLNDHSRGVTFTALDITARTNIENELKEKSSFLSTIMETSPVGIVTVDKTGNITYANRRAEQILGLVKDVITTSTYDAPLWNHTDLDGSPLPEEKQPFNMVKKSLNTVLNVQHGITWPDGTLVILSINATPIKDNHGKFNGMIASIEDISELRQAEEKARKLARAVEESSVSVMITDKEGVIEYVNPFFTELTGYCFEEAKGKTPNILKSGHQSTAFYEKLWNTILSGRDYEGEFLNKKKTGELYWAKAVVSPITNSDGSIINFVSIKQDITEKKRIDEELVAAKEKAQESDKLKSAFLQNISHEIRTPLNGILGFGGLLSETNHSPEDRKEMLSIVKQSSNRLLKTITDYMDMARIVTGTMNVHKKEFPLQPVIEEAIQEVRFQCETDKIELTTVIPNECGSLRLFSDNELIRKTLTILLENALKFTSQGEIKCGCRVIPGYVEFYVQDTGVGIASDKLKIIFDSFVQEDMSDTRGYEGSGLGLSIARGLVHLLGGSISVTSEKGKGSTFTFNVPYNENEAEEKTTQTEAKSVVATGKPLVLLAEDDESNYLYMAEVLQQAGCDYLLAKNGKEAVEFCKQHPDITLVLMDIKMPVMNGIEATMRIREFRPGVPIIATTAYAQTGDEQIFLSSGCSGYLPKPISPEKLKVLFNENLV
jgi:PAS domain S-box-containing protein